MKPALDHEIARLTRALRWHRAVYGSGWGVVGALAGILIMAGIARLTPLWHQAELRLAGVWAVGGGLFLGSLLGYAWPAPLSRRLRMFDRRLHLADRLTTAWELSQGRINAPAALTRLQQEETLTAVRAIDPRPAFPLRPPRAAGILALVLLLGLIPALFLANPQESVLARREAQQQATEAAIAQLETAQEALADSSTLSAAEREVALKALEEALATLRDRHSTSEEQRTALSEAERQLAALRSPEAAAQVQRLAEAAPLSSAEIVQPLTTALQQGDPEAAAEYLRSLIDPTYQQSLTAEEMLALADAFTQIADTLQSTDPALAEQFQDIAQELYSGDIASASEAVQRAADTLSATAQADAPNQTLEQAQASLQQAQESLGDAQRPTTAQASAENAATQPGAAAGPGKPKTGADPGAGDEPGGIAVGGHHEDVGSSNPYGAEEAPRLSGQGGDITLPRQETFGPPQTTLGTPGDTRVPYEDVYTTYVEAARADLARSAYPPALRAYVREYFNGLEP